MKMTIRQFTREQFDTLRDLILRDGKPQYDAEDQGDAENGPKAPEYLGHEYNGMTARADDDNVVEIVSKTLAGTVWTIVTHPGTDPQILDEIQNGPQF